MHRLFFQPHEKYRLLLIIGDLVILSGGLAGIAWLGATEKRLFPWELPQALAIFGVLLLLTTAVFYTLGLYDPTQAKGASQNLLTLGLGLGLVIILYSALAYFFIPLRPGKINLVLLISLTFCLTFAWRQLVVTSIRLRPERLLLVGNDPIMQDIREILEKSYGQHYTIAGQWHRQTHNPHPPSLHSFVQEQQIDTVVFSVHSQVARQLSNDLVNIQFGNKHIIDAYTFYQFLTRKYPAYFLDDFWLLINARRESFFPAMAERLKRLMDLGLALLALPLALPICLIVSVAIKWDSPGPVLFIQERLGLNEVPFKLYKFRTMVDNAEALTGPKWSTADDPRITRVGRILRKLRLDELPQLLNVLKGDMSIVGPRPIRKHFADIIDKEVPHYRLRFLAKPGLTGWAQVNYDYAGSNEGQAEKLQYDLFYLVHQSLWLDLLILFKTIKTMVWGKGI